MSPFPNTSPVPHAPRRTFAARYCLAWTIFTLLGGAAPLAAQQDARPALETTPVAPVKFETRGSVYFADFGADAYGKLRLTLPTATSGNLTVRFGEKLDADGSIDRHPPGSVSYLELTLPVERMNTVYEPPIPTTPKHREVPIKTPSAVGDVTPFRYVEIEGCPVPLRAESLRQLFVHTAFKDDAGTFESSDPTLNAVWNLCKHTVKATTAFGVYIDGDRERKPYEADAYLNYLAHMACDANPAVGRYTFEYLLAHSTWPTEWSHHMVMLAAADYAATGDPVLATKHYAEIKKKLLMEKARGDGLLRAPGIVDWPEAERDNYDEGDPDAKKGQMIGPEINTVVNAFYFRALGQLATLAQATGRTDEARDLTVKAQKVTEAFNRVFFDPARGVYTDGEGSRHASLHANLFALAFGLVPPERQGKVADFVESRGMACSVYGAGYLLEALYNAGRPAAAVRLLASHETRSWWHMIDLGSTMTLEAWDAKFKPNLTWNHAWAASPAYILPRYVLGVRPLEAGYRKVLIAPQPGGLEWASGKVPTVRGPVGVKVQPGKFYRLELDVPPGVAAKIEVAAADLVGNVGPVLLNGAPAVYRLNKGTLVVDPVAAGHQVLTVGKETSDTPPPAASATPTPVNVPTAL